MPQKIPHAGQMPLKSEKNQTGNDYETGEEGFFMPTGYKSRDIFGAFGVDLTADESLEFTVLRLDQTDVEFPGLVFDLNFLVTGGYEVTYTSEASGFEAYGQ